MNYEKNVRKLYLKKCNVRLHDNLMEDIDLGGNVVYFEESLGEEEFVWQAILLHIDQTLDSLSNEALEDLEDVWETRQDIKNFIDKYYKMFAYLSCHDIFCQVTVKKLYDEFVKFDLKFKDCIWEWVGFKF